MKHVVTYWVPGKFHASDAKCAEGEGHTPEMAQYNAFKHLLEYVDANDSLPYHVAAFIRSETTREEKLRVWHKPGSATDDELSFKVGVDSITDARGVLRDLARYDEYLGLGHYGATQQGVDEYRDGVYLVWRDDRGNGIETSREGLS